MSDVLSRNTAAQTEPCPLDGRMEPHRHTADEWRSWDRDARHIDRQPRKAHTDYVTSNWVKTGTERTGTVYTSDSYSIRQHKGGLGFGRYWQLRHVEQGVVWNGDTLGKAKQAAEIHAAGLDPNKFYNWPAQTR